MFKDSATVTLGELGEFSNGINFGKESMGSGWGIINVKDIFRSGIKLNLSSLDQVDVAGMKKASQYTVRKHDLYFVRSSVKREGIGLVSYSASTNQQVVHCGFIIRYRVQDSRANPIFLTYALRSPYFRETLKGLSSGTAIVNITQAALRTLEVELPRPEVQIRIANFLYQFDELIESNSKRIQILAQLAEIIYREWFIHFRFPGSFSVKMSQTQMGPIPASWKILTLGEVVEDIIDYRGKTPKKLNSDWSSSGIVALSALNVKEGRLVNLDSAKFVSEELYARWMKSTVRCGDILLTSEAPLGELYLLTDDAKYCLSQRLFSIRVDRNQLLPTVLYGYLASYIGQQQIASRSSGTTVVGIRQSELRKIPVIAPDLDLQRQAEAICFPLYRQMELLRRKNEALRKTRDLLLPELISGQINVDQAETAVAQAV